MTHWHIGNWKGKMNVGQCYQKGWHKNSPSFAKSIPKKSHPQKLLKKVAQMAPNCQTWQNWIWMCYLVLTVIVFLLFGHVTISSCHPPGNTNSWKHLVLFYWGVLCISTNKQVLCTPFAGRNRLSDAKTILPSLMEQNKKKLKESRAKSCKTWSKRGGNSV